MDDIRKLMAERGAIRALITHWAVLDSSNFEAVTTGFAEDGVWHRQGKELKGPDMVRAAMAERSKGARTRHVVSNMLTTLKSETDAEIDFYMTVFSYSGEADAPLPAPMNVPNSVGLSHAALRRDGAEWKIRYLKSTATFQRK